MCKIVELVRENADLTLRTVVEQLELNGETPESASEKLIEALREGRVAVSETDYRLLLQSA